MIEKRFYDDSIWALKYRPNNIDDLIATSGVKTQLKNILKEEKLPNQLYFGRAGCGKTSAAFILASQLDREYLYINGSVENGIDLIRTKLTQFVSSCSWNGNKKIVILDEIDRATPQLQDALKAFLEEFSKSTNFIFISNHKNKIIPPLQSRLQSVNFDVFGPEQEVLKKDFYKKCLWILDNESIEYDKKAVGYIVCQHFPDMRKCLTELQKLAQQGKLVDLVEVRSMTEELSTFFKLLSEKNFTKLRKFAANITDPQKFYSNLGDDCVKYIDPSSLVEFCIMLNTFSYQSAFVADAQVNVTAFICECLSNNIKIKDDTL